MTEQQKAWIDGHRMTYELMGAVNVAEIGTPLNSSRHREVGALSPAGVYTAWQGASAGAVYVGARKAAIPALR